MHIHLMPASIILARPLGCVMLRSMINVLAMVPQLMVAKVRLGPGTLHVISRGSCSIMMTMLAMRQMSLNKAIIS